MLNIALPLQLRSASVTTQASIQLQPQSVTDRYSRSLVSSGDLYLIGEVFYSLVGHFETEKPDRE